MFLFFARAQPCPKSPPLEPEPSYWLAILFGDVVVAGVWDDQRRGVVCTVPQPRIFHGLLRQSLSHLSFTGTTVRLYVTSTPKEPPPKVQLLAPTM